MVSYLMRTIAVGNQFTSHCLAMELIAKICFVLLIVGCSAVKPKIVGGEETTIQDVPYQLEQEQKILGLFWSFSCGAVIAGPNSVITAGHCVKGVTAAHMRFRSGNGKRGAGTIHEALKIDLHPDYQDLGGIADNDIAVVRISPAFDFSETTQSINITDREPVAGDNATVSGWGLTSESASNPADIVRKVTVPVIDRETCREDYGDNQVSDAMVCAGLEKGGKDSCSGDSGGPFVVDGVLAGLVSWGQGCAEAGYPGVYTNVALFRDWAQGIIDANSELL